MRRLLRILGLLLLLGPVLAVALVFAALNTDPGRRLAEGLIGRVTSGTVVVQGLAGRFPDALRLAHLEVRDAQGVWLQANDVALDWSPTALVHRQASIQTLSAASLDVARLPASAPAPAQPAAPSKPFTLPVRVTIDHLDVPRATLGHPVLGTAATLAIAGSADLPTLEAGQADLVLTTPGSPARYQLTGAVTDERIDAHLMLAEPAGGLVAHLASLPDIGALHLDATVAGPRSALATVLDLSAGPLTAKADGTVDLVDSRLSLDATAAAPAMQPAPGVSWQAVSLQAHAAGPFTAPDATGHLVVTAPVVASASLRSLTADVSGNAGTVSINAVADGLRLPGPQPGLLEAAPLHLTATARLDDPARPVRFTLDHPLLAADGTARTAGTPLAAHVALRLPDLAPIAAVGGLVAAGHGDLMLDTVQAPDATSIDAHGTLALTAGPGPSAALIGPDAKLALSARLAGGTVTLNTLTLDGAAVNLAAHGVNAPDGLDVTATATLPNLALAVPTLNGDAHLDAHVHGPANALAVDAAVAGDVGASGIPRAPIHVTAALTGLPGAPAGHIAAGGTLAGAPVDLALDATRNADGALHATITRADWRSLHAEGDLTLPAGATLPLGHVALRMARLDDLRPLIHQPVTGAVTATADLTEGAVALDVDARNAGLPVARVGHATLKARVADPLAHRSVAATLVAEGIEASGAAGNARLDVTGPEDALALKTNATLDSKGVKAQVAAAALLNVAAKQVRLDTLTVTGSNASIAPETVRLLAPATVRFGDGVALDQMRLGVRQAVLDVSGRLSPTLDATVTLRTPADIAAAVAPDYALDGTVALDAKLTGTPAAPGGIVRLTATGLRARSGTAHAFPAANLTATATLLGTAARLDAHLAAGTAQVAATGTVPLGATGALNLRTTGALNLALLDPILTPNGRRVQGRVSLDLAVAGTTAAPAVSGTVQLAGGEVQDFAQGARISDLNGTVRAEGQTLRLSLQGRAGNGTVAASGTVGAFAPGLPVDLAITMRNARPLSSDIITATLDADLTVRGPAAAIQAGGHMLVRSAELRIPRTLPASIVVLNVRRPGEKPPAAPGPPTVIGLNLVIDAPNSIFLRGRGVDAELAGKLAIHGSSVAPQVGGGLDMRSGTLSIAGTTLTFSRGRVGFDGTGVEGRIDPTLDFSADSSTATVTATLAIGGYVSKPKITLSSVPALPQDEVLAYLLFKRSAKELGPFQLAEIAAAVAELTGVGGGAADPLDSVRKSLGLDRLSVGAGATPSSGPTLEAGRYVRQGVYVGAKQGTTGGQTQATVQIDITKGLKLESDAGTGPGGNSVGATYQFEY